MFEINKGKSLKPATPSKNVKEPEKPKEEEPEEKKVEEKPVEDPEPISSQEDLNTSTLNEDELILKDECIDDIDQSDDKIDVNEDEEPPKETIEEESKDLDGETSNIDNEDSINLTIGEEEEQMLRDEDDIKPKGNIFYGYY